MTSREHCYLCGEPVANDSHTVDDVDGLDTKRVLCENTDDNNND